MSASFYDVDGYEIYTNPRGSLVINASGFSGVIFREWATQDITFLKSIYPRLAAQPNGYETRTGDIIIRKTGPSLLEFYDVRDGDASEVKDDAYLALGLFLAQYVSPYNQ